MRMTLRASAALLVVCGALLCASPAARAASVSAPSSVTVGASVLLRAAGFHPGVTVSVQLVPTVHVGGNCCGVIAVQGRRVGSDGRAVIEFVWPASYVRSGGFGSSTQVAWQDGESATIVVFEDRSSLSASTRTTVLSAAAATPGVGGTWAAPPFNGTLLRLDGSPAVPFGLVVKGSIAGTATLQAGATRRLSVTRRACTASPGRRARSCRSRCWPVAGSRAAGWSDRRPRRR